MNRKLLVPFLAAGAAVVILGADAAFTVAQGEQAVVTRLGRPGVVINRDGRDPGFHFKAPLIDRVVRLERRQLAFAAEAVEAGTLDGARRVVTAALYYRISDPLVFQAAYRSPDAEKAGLQRLARIAATGALGGARSTDLAAGRAAMEARALGAVRNAVRTRPTGLTIERVVLTRIDQSAADQAAIILRMQAANRVEAAAARTVLDQRKRELSERHQAQRTDAARAAAGRITAIRAATARERADILAASYGRDPGLAAYYRTLKAYETSLANDGTTLILSPDSPMLKYLKAPAEAPQTAPRPR